MADQNPLPSIICSSAELPELGKRAFAVDYRGERQPALLIRFKGAVYGYLNRCVHVPKRLDREEEDVFDATGQFLQCSLHAVQYYPETGLARSEICAGKRLTALRVEERDGWIRLTEKRAALAGGE
jgi:nitrite reductase/ring-hydroxylating ferredoxin subunit